MYVFAIFIFFLGIMLFLGAYIDFTYGIKLMSVGGDSVIPEQEPLGIMFVVLSFILIIMATSTIRYKYYSTEKIPVRDLKCQIFTNSQLLTYTDGDKSYVWPLANHYKVMYRESWQKNECVGLRKYYNRKRDQKEALILYDKKYK